MNKALINFCAMFVLIMMFVFAYYYDRQNLKPYVAHANQENSPNDRNLYEKLLLGKNIRYLVLGDSIGQSDGAGSDQGKWFNGLDKQLRDAYKGVAFHDIVATGGAVTFGGWIDYLTHLKHPDGYDMVILCFGQNDQGDSLERFQESYEALVRQIMHDYPLAEIVTLIENSLSSEAFAVTIKSVSTHYDLLNVDLRKAFKESGKLYSTLTDDGVHPNTEGYDYYTKSIYKTIASKYSSQPATRNPFPITRLYDGSKLFESGRRLTNWENAEGFKITSKGVLGTAGSSIEQTFTGSLIGIEKWADVTGGKYRVFIDGKLINEFNNRAPFRVNWENLISDDLDKGTHKIRIEVPSNEAGTIQIASIITN
ncbi:SGNH/GDSL hydrolase family protein [Cohnella mopanensis]|uniref:SGNH/GDSL hydrolase family protein n=1 Tax=Cohnella mopanensis TaxID=2911966 RepID=UPI001EF8DFD0|nr:SGNH/GDSL hydrolase family protein [Cohnella mopanensis]